MAVSAAPVSVREATAADHEALVDSLVNAFMDDPVACWAAPFDASRAKMLRRFFRVYLKAKQRHETVWMSEDRSGAALWLPPGITKTTLAEDLAMVPSMFNWRLLHRAPMVARGLLSMEGQHPQQPDHFYLAAIGVDPSKQGMGVGGALLEPVLQICDRDGIPAYLEASRFENVAYYARFGFRETREVRLPRGPSVYLMWREP